MIDHREVREYFRCLSSAIVRVKMYLYIIINTVDSLGIPVPSELQSSIFTLVLFLHSDLYSNSLQGIGPFP